MSRIVAVSVLLTLLTLTRGTKGERNVSDKSPALSKIDNLRVEILRDFVALWRDLTESEGGNPTDLALLESFRRICRNITEAESLVNPPDNYLFSSDLSYALTDAEMTNINVYYETFVRFQEENLKGTRKPPLAWSDLAETYLQTSDYGISKSLEKIHRYATTDIKSDNLFKKAFKEVHSNVCNLKQSPHQTLYNLYNAVALAELKANTILQFSYMLLKLYNKGNFTMNAQIARIKYEKNAMRKEEVARYVLEKADRSIYMCDPKEYVEGVTYAKLTKLLQGYIENEINLNPYQTCMENCAYYEFAEYNGCYQNQFCSSQPPCRGKVLECRYVDSDMNICRSSRTSERRYDWIEYESGKVLGSKGVCEAVNLFKVDSWWRYLFWHCSYCLCLCDDSHGSDRYFNMREVNSDVEENKVVTGVRLVKHNRIIHIQIQQGVLAPRGTIDKSTLSWKPVDNYTIDDAGVESNVDYHTMTWLERSIDTDEVFGPPEHVVTGVRLRKLGNHLNLEIRITPIDFAAGKLFNSVQSYWKGNDNTDASLHKPRTEIKLMYPDIPIKHRPHRLKSKHDQYIQFQATSFEADAGQSTVPFIDTQALISQGFPLSGIGFIHRGKTGSGGFLALKLISYDFTPHLNPEQIS